MSLLGDTDTDSNCSSVVIRTPRSGPTQDVTSTRRTRSELAILSQRRKSMAPKKYRGIVDEIRFLQGITKKSMIPKMSFGRLVREIMFQTSHDVNRISLTALQALQESVEMYVTLFLEDAYLLTLHRKRVTLSLEDLLLIKILRNRST